ncbi:MAG: PAS domain-containing sensor histidine kinase [Magnetococcales bacterium]|nr:PAS domain-containing sensor histidine kinase [Magnetococcales bacterium]MBF0156729.1 PAS domain-containing sensor histidine kinase [Magnetococcales bacterium]
MRTADFNLWMTGVEGLTPRQRRLLLAKLTPDMETEDEEDPRDRLTPMERRSQRGLSYREIMRLLTEESEYVRKIIDLSADMIISVDENRCIYVFNRAAEGVYGYEARDVMGQPVDMLYGDEANSRLVVEQMRTVGFFSGEVTGRRKNGELFPVRLIAARIHNAFGQVVGSVGYSRDLTPEKRAEAREREYHSMQELEKLRRDVEQITRHDLKSPLNSVIEFSDLLLHDSRLDDETRDWIRIIHDSGSKALRLVNLSLDIFKMERGIYKPVPRQTNLVPILEAIRREQDSLARSKGLTWELRLDRRPLPAGTPFEVMGEDSLCYTMLANLLKNAVEAAPGGGTIRIGLYRGARVMIEIRNPGAVPEAIRDRFFEKYTTMGKPFGTGLGTYSARLMAETQGGGITMVTSETEGTTVTVTLPAAPLPGSGASQA